MSRYKERLQPRPANRWMFRTGMQSGLKSLPQKALQLGCVWRAFVGRLRSRRTRRWVLRLHELSRLQPRRAKRWMFRTGMQSGLKSLPQRSRNSITRLRSENHCGSDFSRDEERGGCSGLDAVAAEAAPTGQLQCNRSALPRLSLEQPHAGILSLNRHRSRITQRGQSGLRALHT